LNFEQARQPGAFQHFAERFTQTAQSKAHVLLLCVTQTGQQRSDTGTIHASHIFEIQNETRRRISAQEVFDGMEQLV
jgi:hypothetical protein